MKTQRDDVIGFTKGVMDRLRDFCREAEPAKWEDLDQKDEIVIKKFKNGERKYFIRKKETV